MKPPFDLTAHLGTMTRTVRNLEREGKPAAAVIASRVFPTTTADLWDAITTPSRIARWFLPITGDLKLGGRYQFQGNAGGTITACEPERRIEATWEFGGGVSWLIVSVAQVKDGARLELEHIAHVDNDHWKQFGPGAVGVGWDMGFMGLAMHLHDPATAMKPEDAPAWFATEEYKETVRVTAADWGRAHVDADPTHADAARASAEQTRKFYVGELPPPGAADPTGAPTS